MHNHCTTVARALSINLVSADEASWILRHSQNCPEEQIFVVDIREKPSSILVERFSPIL